MNVFWTEFSASTLFSWFRVVSWYFELNCLDIMEAWRGWWGPGAKRNEVKGYVGVRELSWKVGFISSPLSHSTGPAIFPAGVTTPIIIAAGSYKTLKSLKKNHFTSMFILPFTCALLVIPFKYITKTRLSSLLPHTKKLHFYLVF